MVFVRCAAPVLLVLTMGLVGCVDRPGMMDPDETGTEAPPSAPQLVFGTAADSLSLHEGESVTIHLSDATHGNLPAQVLLLDQDRNVLWRSDVKDGGGGKEIVFQVRGLPASVPRGTALLVTASTEDRNGRRYYATENGMSAQTSLLLAAVRTAVVYDGRLLPIEEGRVESLVAAPELGQAFFANTQEGVIGSIDLERASLVADAVRAGSAPTALSYRGGKLAALLDGGVQVGLFDVASPEVGERVRSLLPPFFLRFLERARDEDREPSVVEVPVRPYARNLGLGCLSDGAGRCDEFVAYGASEVDGSGRGGALRVFDVSEANDPVAPVVMPSFKFPPLLDSSADTVPYEVFAVSGEPGGRSIVLGHQSAGLSCMTLSLGSGPVAVSPVPDGPVFVADEEARPMCGSGTRLVRIDAAWTNAPQFSVMAMRNLLGEDRIGAISQIEVAEDGSLLLVLSEDRVYVLDEMLRVRGSLAAPGARSVAWLKDAGSPELTTFAVADESGVILVDAARMRPIDGGRLEIGATAPGLLSFVRGAGSSEAVIVAVADHKRAVIVARRGL